MAALVLGRSSEPVAADVTTDPDGATALDTEDVHDLIPRHIGTRAELNAWEQANIARAVNWLSVRRRRPVLDVRFVRDLHRHMFGDTWKWAGAYRRHDTNLGVPWATISSKLSELVADAVCWFDHRSYAADECAVRLHHRLTVIHPFPNGNGRHARLYADTVLTTRGSPPFSWGTDNLQHAGVTRARYLDALRAADGDDVTLLMRFVRS